MECPSKIRILGKDYSVEWVNEENPLDLEQVGKVQHLRQTIHARKGMALGQTQDTLLHEAIHAIDYGVSIGLTEAQTHALACGIHAVLHDNPDFSAWLVSREVG